MKIFITGSTGFLGYELLKKLAERNHEITALVRSPEKATHFPASVKIAHGTVENTDAFRESLKGQDVLVHLAALVKMWAPDPKSFDRINVDALESLIRASTHAGIPKMIYSSSFIALGPSNGKPISEADSRRTDHFHNDYERTKFLGDQTARRYQAQGAPLTILYPGVIYGPGNLTDGNIVAKNMIPLLKGRMPFGMKLLPWSYSFVNDVADAFVKVIETDPPSKRYILGGDNRSGVEFYATISDITGKKPPPINIPFPLATLTGYAEYLIAEWFGKEPSMLTHEVSRIYQHSWTYDSALAQKELGYRITSLKDGLTATIRWLKNAGYVK